MNRETPLIIAHRALEGHAPENTLVAYAVALELGLGLETSGSMRKRGG